jgi:rhomboid family GlyGly-CTERM serine protease
MAPALKGGPFRPPWLTGFLCALAFVLHGLPPSVASALALERTPIWQGQLWRLWSGHWLHFSLSHLLWDLLVVVLAAGWLEQLSRKLLVAVVCLAPVLISVALLLFCPDMTRYGGLSGLGISLLTALAITKLLRSAGLPWLVLLLALALKIAVEALDGGSLLGVFPNGTIRNMPEAHAAGFLAGAMLAVLWRTRSKTDS